MIVAEGTPLEEVPQLEVLQLDLGRLAVVAGQQGGMQFIEVLECLEQFARTRLARLSDELLGRQRVAALGFDMVFAEPDDGHHVAVLPSELLDAGCLSPARRSIRRPEPHEDGLGCRQVGRQLHLAP